MVYLSGTEPEILFLSERYSFEECMGQFQVLDKILFMKSLKFIHKNTFTYSHR